MIYQTIIDYITEHFKGPVVLSQHHGSAMQTLAGFRSFGKIRRQHVRG